MSGLMRVSRAFAKTRMGPLLAVVVVVTVPFPALAYELTAGAGGGDCSIIGDWDPANLICALTGDVADTIEITGTGVTLDGDGHRVTGGFVGVRVASQAGDVTIVDLEVVDVLLGIWTFGARTHITETAVNLNNQGWYGITAEGDDAWIENNVVKNSLWFGIDAWGGSRNLIEHNLVQEARFGIVLTNSSHNEVTENEITEFSQSGIRLWRSSDFNTVVSNRLASSKFRPADPPGRPWADGIDLVGFAAREGGFRGPSQNTFSGNRIHLFSAVEDPMYCGICGWAGATENVIDSNFIELEGGGGAAGIHFDLQCNGNRVLENVILPHGGHGISTDSGSGIGSDHNIFSRNSITGSVLPIVVLLGKNNTVEHNEIRESGAVRIIGGRGNTVRYNEMKDGMTAGDGLCLTGSVCEFVSVPCSMEAGVLVGGESESTVSANEIHGAAGVGVLVSEIVREEMSGCPWEGGEPTGTFDAMPAEQNNILDNEIRLSGEAAISLVGADYNQIIGNRFQGNGIDAVVQDPASEGNVVFGNEVN